MKACELQAPLTVVKALLGAFESGIEMGDSLSRLPLHIACLSRASYDVITALSETYPDATKIDDDAGCIPLHYACRKGANQKVIECLLMSNHRGAFSVDYYKLLPIHYACKHNAPAGVIESLLRAHPYSIEATDQYGRTPMDITKASYIGPEKAHVIEALERNPSFWTTTLLNQVERLKSEVAELEAVVTNMSQTRSEEIDRLQRLLSQLTDASNDASKKFKYIKAELEYENSTLKSQIKKMSQDKVEADDHIDKLQQENESLKKEMTLVHDSLKFENASMKVEIKKMKTENTDFKQQNMELFDDNVRLTIEVNRLSDQLEHALSKLDILEGHVSMMKDLTEKMTILGSVGRK